MTISVIGLGKLGLPLAVIFASRSYKVIGIDIQKNISCLLNNNLYVKEPYLLDYWERYKSNILLTTKYKNLGDITFIVVPTPSIEDNSFTSKFIEDILKQIHKPQIVVIVSTVMPNTIDRLSKQYKHLTLIYNPAFVALGSVIKNFLNPNFILIGAETDKVKILEEIYQKVCPNSKIFIMKPLETEIAKLAFNCFITTKISFVNELAHICEGLNIDINNITNAIGTDKRIGHKAFRAGLGYGGPCFPRDNLAFMQFAQQQGKVATMAKITHLINEQQPSILISKIIKQNPKIIGFKSLSYKPNTDICEKSQLAIVYNKLKQLDYKVKIGKGDINIDWKGIVK